MKYDSLKKAVYCVETKEKFESIQEAAAYFDVNYVMLSDQVRGKIKRITVPRHTSDDKTPKIYLHFRFC